jgi:hypothetical protein
MIKEYPTFDRKKFLYRLSRAQYQGEWGHNYQRPGFGTRLLALLLKLVPKVGPFKAAKITYPTAQTEQLYLKSVNASVERMIALLHDADAGRLRLDNRDFDTGKLTRPGEYELTDKAYATLLHKLAGRNFDLLTPAMRDNILQFYSDPKADLATRKKPKDWQELVANLERLKTANVTHNAGAQH